MAKKPDVKVIGKAEDLVGEQVTVSVTDGNRVTEETTYVGIVRGIMSWGIMINYPQRGALITRVIPWGSIVDVKHRAKGVKSEDAAPTEAAPKRRGRKPKPRQLPEPEAAEPEPEVTPEPEPTPEPAPEPQADPEPAPEPDPEPDPEPEPDDDEGSAVGAEDDEDEVYSGEEDDEDFYGADEDFGGEDDDD